VQEADLSKPFKKKDETLRDKNDQLSEISSTNATMHTEDVEIKEIKEKENLDDSCIELLPIPKTAIKFLLDWKKYVSSDFRYRYLKVSNNLFIL